MDNKLFEVLAQSIYEGDDQKAEALAMQVLESGTDPLEAINKGFVVGINQVGSEYSQGDLFLPDLVLAGEAMKAAVAVLEPEMERRGSKRELLGTVVLCTVKGDIHEIGKTLVGTMLAGAGFQVVDMGVDVSAVSIIEKVRQVGADLVGLSALLTTTMPAQKAVVEALEEAGLRDKVKVMVGGAPVTSGWAEEIGADGYGADAAQAVTTAKQLLGIEHPA